MARHSGLDYTVYLSEEYDDAPFNDEQCRLQKGEDLGARMLNALQDILDDGAGAAMIVGSDCLDLGTDRLQQAAQALADHELVLIPAFDGGFVLIGCREANPLLFKSVRWGSNRVLEQTLANARRLDYRVSLLQTVRDIDRLQDLEHHPELLALIASS